MALNVQCVFRILQINFLRNRGWDSHNQNPIPGRPRMLISLLSLKYSILSMSITTTDKFLGMLYAPVTSFNALEDVVSS